MDVTTGVGPEGTENVAPGSGTCVDVGMRVMTCPHPDSKSIAAIAPMANRADFLANIGGEYTVSGIRSTDYLEVRSITKKPAGKHPFCSACHSRRERKCGAIFSKWGLLMTLARTRVSCRSRFSIIVSQRQSVADTVSVGYTISDRANRLKASWRNGAYE